MGTSKKYKPVNQCKICGENVVNLTREEQDAHEEKCLIWKREQKTLF
jgi:hypothetical protein